MSAQKIELIELETKTPCEALLRNVSQSDLINVESVWGPERILLCREAQSAGILVPQHHHWKWTNKLFQVGLLNYRTLCIECAGETQGMMLADTGLYRAKLDPDKGKEIVYVEFVESAPWNQRTTSTRKRFSGVGQAFIRAAIDLSIAEGFGGRIGLHSLPQSNGLYEKLGMSNTGMDSSKNMIYYEFTGQQATDFLN